MRQEVVGATFVACVCGLVVLGTYRPEKNEGKLRIFVILTIAMSFAFLLSLLLLYAFFSYSDKAVTMNMIKTPPNF